MSLTPRNAGIVRGAFALAALISTTAASLAADTLGVVAPASIDAWRTFRKSQPFQVQVIAVSPPQQGKPRTLILSEPPPKTTWPQLAASLSPISSGCSIQRWAIMSGGYVQDVVCTLKNDLGTGLSDRLAALQIEVFGTTSDAPVVALPVPKRSMIAHSLDFRYGAADLNRWLNETDRTFRASPLAESVSFRDVLESNARGVFARNDNAPILWAVDRGATLKASDSEFRRFAVASDLVLGAVASKNAVIVVGRGRVESLAHLPPLRSETALLLAGTAANNLAQSYERNDMLSGKGVDGVDRAPILLSPQLVDTEFGSLLNVADQLLKSWSMAGQVSYADFRYPSPAKYPFGSAPVVEVEKDARTSFLFNWNTDGAAYRQTISGVDVIVPQRTGALSVIYGDPKDRPRNLENTAYDYFSTSGDTSLARVVQYTLLYQIFRQFDVRAQTPSASPRYAAFAASVDDATRRTLKTAMSDVDEKELYLRLRDYWAEQARKISETELAKAGLSRKEFLVDGLTLGIGIAAALRKGEAASNGQLSNALAEFASYTRQRRELTAREKAAFEKAIQTIRHSLPDEFTKFLLANNAEALRNSGVLAVAADKAGIWVALNSPPNDASWNHTAYVVQSKVGVALVGGHNIDAPVVRFTESSTQPRGTVAVTEDANGGVLVTHSPADAGRAQVIAREAGTRKGLDKGRIEAEVNAALKAARAEPPVALDTVRPPNLIAAAKSSEFKFLGSSESAYRLRPLRNDEQQLMSALGTTNKQQAIVFEYLSDGTFEMKRTGSPDVLHVASITAATDALANGLLVSAGGRSPVAVLVKGLPPAKAEAMLAQVQSSLRRYPKERVQHVLSAEADGSLLVERPKLVNARISHNGIRIERQSVKVEQVTDGPYKGFSRVEVPVTIQSQTPLLLRLIFFVKDLTQASMELLLNKITTVLTTLKGPVSMAEVEGVIRKQVLDDLKELNVDAVLMLPKSDPTQKFHDVIIAGRMPPEVAHAG